MKQRTWLSGELEAARRKVQYDEHVKRVLGSRQVLARILRGAAAEYEGYSVEQIVCWIDTDIEIARTPLRPGGKEKEGDLITGDNTESKIPGEGTITYDIRFRAWIPGNEAPSMIKLLINIEAQKSFYLKYRIVTRGIFYGARMISEQLDREFTDSDYDGLKKVYSIWICMNAPKKIGNAMTEYRITKRDIIGRMPERKASYDKLSVVIICLYGRKNKRRTKDLHGFLNTILSSWLEAEEKEKILVQEYGMVMEHDIGEELREMCNLSEAIEEQGIEQGIERGIEQGLLLAKKIITLVKEGRKEEEIAEICGISVDKVREITAY